MPDEIRTTIRSLAKQDGWLFWLLVVPATICWLASGIVRCAGRMCLWVAWVTRDPYDVDWNKALAKRLFGD